MKTTKLMISFYLLGASFIGLETWKLWEMERLLYTPPKLIQEVNKQNKIDQPKKLTSPVLPHTSKQSTKQTKLKSPTITRRHRIKEVQDQLNRMHEKLNDRSYKFNKDFFDRVLERARSYKK